MIATSTVWLPPPDHLTLDADEVHVWCASLELEKTYICQLYQRLSEDERHRAEQFYFEKDQKHYIVARSLLRIILSRYLSLNAREIRFCYGINGKPALIAEQDGKRLRFNLSHSQGLAIYAVTQNRDIGVDIEYIHPNFLWKEIAERFFSSQENAMLRTLPANLQYRGFFRCWTCKEAYVKATGKGLSIPLDQFDVSLAPGEPAALLRTQWDREEAARWSLQELIPTRGYVAALAVEGDGWRLQCWQWLPG